MNSLAMVMSGDQLPISRWDETTGAEHVAALVQSLRAPSDTDMQVSFDGEHCTYTSPDALIAGQLLTF